MNRLTGLIKTVAVIVKRRDTLTNEQLAGNACALCGDPFSDSECRVPFGWIGLPFIGRRAWACKTSCIISAVDDVEALFRSAIPARQPVAVWHLGLDDNPLTIDEDDRDVFDREYADAIGTQPKRALEITHPGGILTTRPLPQQYAEGIAAQARRLGFTARVSDEAASATTPPATASRDGGGS